MIVMTFYRELEYQNYNKYRKESGQTRLTDLE